MMYENRSTLGYSGILVEATVRNERFINGFSVILEERGWEEAEGLGLLAARH